jgi:hypothetical protein
VVYYQVPSRRIRRIPYLTKSTDPQSFQFHNGSKIPPCGKPLSSITRKFGTANRFSDHRRFFESRSAGSEPMAVTPREGRVEERDITAHLRGLVDGCFEEGQYEAGLTILDQLRSPNYRPAA